MKLSFKNSLTYVSVSCLILSFVFACAGPEQKKLRFYDKGKTFYEKEDYKKARVEFKNAIQIDPRYADAYYLLGMTELKDKNIKEAFGRLNRTIELNPKLWDAQLQLGKLFLAAKLYDKSMEKVKIVLEGQPDNVSAHILETAILLSQNKIADAQTSIKKIDETKCTDPEYFILVSAMKNSEGKGQDAEDIIKKGITLNPKSIQLHATLARFYAAGKRYDDLITVLRQMIELEPANDTHRFNLSDVYLETGKNKEAEDVIVSLLDGKEHQEDRYIHIAEYYLNRKRVDDAKKILLKGKEKISKCYDINIFLAEIDKAENKNDEAIAVLKSSLDFDRKKSSPGILKTKNSLASLYLSMNDRAQATQYINEILKEDPKNIGALYAQGLISLDRKQGDLAVSSFRVVTSQQPENESAYVYLARAHLMKNEKLMATDVLKNALKVHPESALIKKELVRLNIFNKEYDTAETGYKELISNNAKDIDSLMELGDLYIVWGKKDKALETYRKIIKTFPDKPIGYIKTAQYYISAGQMNQAAKELETARATLPDSFEILSNLVKVYVSTKTYQKAIAICDQQIGKKKNELVYKNLLGNTYEAAGKTAEALKAYENALAMDPKWPMSANSIARICLTQGKMDEALKILQDAIDKNQDNTPGILTLGAIYEKKGDIAKAKSLYEGILKKQPNNNVIKNNLSYLISQNSSSSDDLKRGIVLCEGILKDEPDGMAAMDTLGWLYYRTGDYDKALGLVSKVVEKNPDNPELNYHKGMIQYKKGQMADAKKCLEKAVASKKPFKGFEEAKTVLGQIKA